MVSAQIISRRTARRALQRKVLQPVNNERRDSGEYELSIPVGSLASGTYSVQVRAVLANGTTIVERRTLIIAR